MNEENKTNSVKRTLSPDTQKLLLRVALGFVFIIAGFKITFPADASALVISYTNPEKGWISPYFASLITDTLGMEISNFLFYQGLLEMLLGVLLIFGLFTSFAAVIMGLLYWSFTIANPIAGEIRLSRDLALMAFSFALAYYGAGKYSIDKKLSIFYREGKEEIVSLLLRFGLGFTLIVSSLFFGGVMNNPLNTTLPNIIVFILGSLLLLNIKVKWVSGIIGIWMLYAIGDVMLAKETLFKAFDGPKREIAFFIGTLILVMMKNRDSLLTFKIFRRWR